MTRSKFPRIALPAKPDPLRKPLKPCVNCGKGLGTCRGGWCQKCVTQWIENTTPDIENVRSANEELGRRQIGGTKNRQFDLPNI